ncbi:succinate dehydrogenase assembly factor 1, mitochondrial [Lates japonicus]|uniref:Succinate dehydrogenase assembly factor 1, mitochondrial n=1 Tax=Lates japonicus TaxID=270547 RepID=A0AAD3N9X5_LATJO|nr:succinate dehydrogenase assembly factor 1, mitochondrial [Lates japonicus]
MFCSLLASRCCNVDEHVLIRKQSNISSTPVEFRQHLSQSELLLLLLQLRGDSALCSIRARTIKRKETTLRVVEKRFSREVEFFPMSRHSKLQKQVLALYRQFLRAGQDKPGFIPRIRDEFRENARIKKTDVMHIEYLYRRGQRQLEQLRDVNTKQLGSFAKPKDQS